MTKAPSKFAAWQEAKQVRREGIIDDYLTFLAKTKVKVRNPTDLADLVAKHISQVEGEPCNKATLLRNVRYKAKILSFQARSISPGVKALNSRTVGDPTARALITSSQLEIGNLKRELERLDIYINSLEEQVDRLKGRGRQLPNSENSQDSAAPIQDSELPFIRTCQAFLALVSHLRVVIEIDIENLRIIDKSRRRDNVIVDTEMARPFIEWLNSQGGVK